MTDAVAELSPLECATEITIAWLSNPNTRASAEDVPAFLQTMHSAVLKLNSTGGAQEEPEQAQEYTPAVTVRKSLASPDHIISLIDGKPYKTLKRHVSTHGLTPVQYRERYGLKSDYPMVAPAYAETRRELAKKIGLGRKPGLKPGQKAPQAKAVAPEKVATPAKPGAAAKTAAPAKADARAKGAAPTKAAALAKPSASAKTAARDKAAAPAKPARRKKLGLQFGDSGAAAAAQS